MTDQTWSSAGAVRNGLLVIAVCLGGLIVWSLTAQLHGAVLAGGTVQVVSGGQVVQHADGGRVERILVRNGDRVRAGQEVLILDADDLLEQQVAVSRRLFETRLAMDRLHSESVGSATLTLRPEILDAAQTDHDLSRRVDEERMHFDAWRDAISGRDAQLEGRIAATGATLQGMTRQGASLNEALAFATTRLADRRALLARGLERASAVAEIEREKLGLEAQIAALEARMAEMSGGLEDLAAERGRLVTDDRQRALAEFRDLAAQEADMLSQLRLIEASLQRLTLRAPAHGVVHDLQIVTEGGVVAPGQTLMTIVPDDQGLLLSVRVTPEQIDSVHPGQISVITFPGLDARSAQELEARVMTISPDVIQDALSGQRYYAVDLAFDEAGRAAVLGASLIPGMPVVAHIQTRTRTPAAYLLRPMADFFRTALGEA